jgi:hypothetical protein
VSNHQVDDSEVLDLVSSASLTVPWDIAWQELDLIFGLARLASGEQVLLNPADFGIVPAGGVQLPGVEVRGSDAGNIIYASSNSSVYGGDNSDSLYSVDGYTDNVLVGEEGSDRFVIASSGDYVVGGSLIENANSFGLTPYLAEVDSVPDLFYLTNSGSGASDNASLIADFRIGVDRVFVDGEERGGEWSSLKADLALLGFNFNAAPMLRESLRSISREFVAGQQGLIDLTGSVTDPDEDELAVVILSGPEWVSSSGLQIVLAPPIGTALDGVATYGVHDGLAMVLGEIQLSVTPGDQPVPSPAPLAPSTGPSLNFVGDSSNIKIVQDEQFVRVTGARGDLSIPLGAVDKVTLDSTSSSVTRLSVSDRTSGLEVQIDTGDFSLEGTQITDSIFEFAKGARAKFISTALQINGSNIVMRKGGDSVEIRKGVVRKSFFSTGRHRDSILLDSAVTVKGNTIFDLGNGKDSVTVDAEIRKATFELGKGADQIIMKGAVKKASIDLGVDKASDVVTIASEDLISKKIKLINFDKKDELIVAGESFGYDDLPSNGFDRIKVRFRDETSSIVPEESSGSNASTGFDFL